MMGVYTNTCFEVSLYKGLLPTNGSMALPFSISSLQRTSGKMWSKVRSKAGGRLCPSPFSGGGLSRRRACYRLRSSLLKLYIIYDKPVIPFARRAYVVEFALFVVCLYFERKQWKAAADEDVWPAGCIFLGGGAGAACPLGVEGQGATVPPFLIDRQALLVWDRYHHRLE